MRKILLIVFTIIVSIAATQSILAGDEREYVGETTVTTLPNVGIITMNDLCDADFRGARMCSSSDIIRNGGVGATLPAANAWIQPTLVAGELHNFALDVSGMTASEFDSNFLSCRSWSNLSEELTGLVLTSTGHIETAPIISTLPTPGLGCSENLPVACCAVRRGR